MQESNKQSGSSGSLEQEIALIEQELASKRAVLDARRSSGAGEAMPHEKETLREVVQEQFPSRGPVSQQSQSVAQGQAQPSPVVDPPSYLSDEHRGKIQDLINTAFSVGIADALKQARATGNAALIDAFHDALIDELYDHLVERGKIKKL